MILRDDEAVLIQGVSDQESTFWAERMIAYGTRIVGEVDWEPAGEADLGLPAWRSASAAAQAVSIDMSVLFSPPGEVKAAALDAIEAGIRKLVVLSEHVPVQDVFYVLAAAEDAGCRMLGPGAAGLVTPGEGFVGTMPAFDERLFKPGKVGVIARSGSLGALVCRNLVQAGLGISAFIGLGGEPILGTTIRDALEALERDSRTEAIALVGEIGGVMEEEAAEHARDMTKPVAAYIAGATAPPGRRMGHAGAIIMGARGSFTAKKAALEAAGVPVVPTPRGLPVALGAHGGV